MLVSSYHRVSSVPELAIILATYNEADNLGQLVEALESLELDLQLVVADNNSPDGTGLVAYIPKDLATLS